jgi:hypothetical protein
VYVGEDGRMHCSCCYTERMGIPCRHVFHILCYYTFLFKGFTSVDIDIRYHVSYSHYVADKSELEMTAEEIQIRRKLIALRLSDWKMLPHAPAIESFLDKTHAVGSLAEFNLQSGSDIDYDNEAGSNVDFLTVCNHIKGMMKLWTKAPVVHNYTREQVSHAIAHNRLSPDYCMETSGVSAVQFDWETDPAAKYASPARKVGDKAVYDLVMGFAKELITVADSCSPSRLEQLRHDLGGVLGSAYEYRNERNRATQGQVPKGTRLSCLAPNPSKRKKNKKQRHY